MPFSKQTATAVLSRDAEHADVMTSPGTITAATLDRSDAARTRVDELVSRRRRIIAAVASAVVAALVVAPAASAATCSVVYSGETLVDPGATTTLAADVSAGLLGAAYRRVTFTASDGEGAVWQYSALTSLGGRASVRPSLPDGVYAIVASVAADASQPGCSTAAAPNDRLLSVSSTTASRFGGTGTITATSGTVRFGLHLRALADGSASGRVRLRIHPPNPALPALVFRAITVNHPPNPARPCQADVTGSGNLDGQPGYTYALTAVDTGRKSTDAFALRIDAPDGSTLFSTDGLRSLSQGRITYFPPSPIRPSTDSCVGVT